MSDIVVARPEAGLPALRDRLYDLYRSLRVLDDPALRARLVPVLRKLEVARLLDEEYVVAVTGLQGVGKTTLVRAIYGIEQGTLPEGVGRGEKVPVWVVEQPEHGAGGRSFRAEVVELADVEVLTEGDGTLAVSEALRTRPVSREELLRLAQSPDPHHFLLKLYVPPTFFQGSSRSFLLLPGVEQRDTSWGELARHALSCSDAAVFVANETVWARASAQRVLEDVEEALKGGRPIFALSGSDQSRDQNRELAETVADERDLEEDERDRVVRTDPHPAEGDGPDWRLTLRTALDRYAATTKEARQRQLQHLEMMIQGEVMEILLDAKQEADRKKGKYEAAEFANVRNVTDLLEAEVAKLRTSYAAELGAELGAYGVKAKKALDAAVMREGGWTKFKNLFGGKSLNDRHVFRRMVEDAWASPEGTGGDSLALAHARALNRTVTPLLARHNALAAKGTNREGLLGTYHEQDGERDTNRVRSRERGLTSDTLNDVAVLLNHDSHEEVSDNFRNSVAALPALAVEAARVGTLAPGLFNLEDRAFAPADQIEKVGEEFETLRKSHSGLLKGVGLMLGVDYLPDQDFTLISGLLGKAGVPAAATGPLAVGVLSIAAVGYGAVSVASAINRTDLDKSDRGHAAIDEIVDRTLERFLAEFDRTMGLLVEHVRTRLTGYYHLDLEFARVARLQKSCADAHEARFHLQERIHPLLLA